MKGKFRILGHVGLALFVACALMLAAVPAAKVEASSSVSDVWMEFAAGGNAVNNNALYTIHFTTGSALSRGVDTITVLFPDGMDSTMGPVTTQDTYDFELGAADASAAYYQVDPTGDPLGTGAAYVACTADATVAGYRVKVTTPVDIPATTAATLQILAAANIDTPASAATAANPYKIKVATSQDTTFVLSSAFPVGTALATAPDTVLVGDGGDDDYPTSLVAGANAAYQFFFTPTTTVPEDGTGTVTVQFPVGTTFPDPATIAVADVIIGNDCTATTNDSRCSAVTVNTAARTVTATTQEALTNSDTKSYIYFKTGCGISNPKTVSGSVEEIYMWTSTDGQKVAASFGSASHFTIVAGSATKLAFNNDALNSATRSDDATIVYACTDALVIESQDTYGNLVSTGTQPTVKLSVTPTGAGAFSTDATGDSAWSASGVQLSGGTDDAFYRPTSAGTHTLKAVTEGSPDLADSEEWTVYVAPAVVLKDASGNTIGTYAPTTTLTDADEDTYGGAWIQAAIDAAFPGDTVTLGGTADDPGIYELSAVIDLDKQITLTSANGRDYTTLRNTATLEKAIDVTCDGTAANPVIIDGLTIERLRSGTEIRRAVFNDTYDYVTVQNCTFNYIQPVASMDDDKPGGVVVFTIDKAWSGNPATFDNITSATVSDNKFNNCCTSWFVVDDTNAANIVFVIRYSDSASTSYTITGATISGNELTDCSGYGISVKGYIVNSYVTASITNNTITNGFNPINLAGYTKDITITGNTVTGAYRYGIEVENFSWWVEATLNPYANSAHDGVVIKNNTVTGTAGSYAVWLGTRDLASPSRTAPVVQYNTISGNNGYAIGAGLATVADAGQDCKYNWYGDASGPYYSALSGATVTTSNTAGTGDKITDNVTYYPWLYKSKAFVVTDNAAYWAQRVSLGVGWNTLSTPALLITTADTIAELMPDYATNMEYGYKWDPAAGGWVNIGTSSLDACSAYYIKMFVADSVLLQYAATETDTPTKLLSPGWNLIGLANFDSMLVNEAVASVLKDSAGLPGYSQVISPSLNTSSWSYSATAASCTSYMSVGEGYWIYMQNDCTLAGFTMLPLVPDLD